MKISGASNSTGFHVVKYSPNGIGIQKVVSSKNYNRNMELKFSKKYRIAYLCVFTLYCLLWLFIAILSGQIALIVLAIIMMIMNALSSHFIMTVLFFSEVFGKNTKEWHACEHKVIAMLKSKKTREITIENLKKMSRITPDCGSVMIFFVGTLPLVAGILSLALIITRSTVNLLLYFFVFLILPLLVLILALLTQFFFTTAEPSQDKLEEALEAAREFYK